MAKRDIGTRLTLDGEAEFKNAVKNIDQELRVLASEMGAVTSSFDKNNASVSDLKNKNQVYEKQIEAQRAKLAEYNKMLTESNAAQDKAAKAVADAKAKFGEQSAEVKKAEEQLTQATKKLNDYQIGANYAVKSLNQLERAQAANNEQIEKMSNGGIDGASENVKKLGDNAKKAGDDAEKSSPKWDKFKSVVSGACAAATAAVTAVAAATVAMTKSVVDAANDVAQYGDEIDKASQKIGVSAEFYQEWDAVLQHSGSSMGNMTTTFKTLANASQNASKKQQAAFEALGLSMEQVSSMSTEQLFESVIYGLQNMEEGTQRTAIATALLGKGSMELGALFNTSAEDTQAMIDTVNELGGVMSNDAVKASAAYQDAMQDLNTTLDGAKRNIISNFLPAITGVIGGLTALFGGQGGGIEQVNAGIKEFINQLTANIPKVLEAGVGIVTGLIGAITENLPALATAAVDVVMMLSNSIVDNLPTVIQAGMQMLMVLSDGIAAALPELAPTLTEVIINIVDMLIDNIDGLIDAAIAIATGLADGIISALPILLERAPEIIGKLALALIEAVPKLIDAAVNIVGSLAMNIAENLPLIIDTVGACLGEIYLKIVDGGKKWVESFEDIGGKVYDWVQGLKEKLKEAFDKIIENFTELITPALDVGKNIIEGIANGIKNGVKAVKDKVKGACDDLLGGIKDFFGIHSPSTVFEDEVGVNLALGLANGFTEKMGKLSGEMSEAVPKDYKIGVTVTDTKSAKKAIDVLVKDYESGLLNKAQYDKLYNQTIEKLTKEREQVAEYSNQKLVAAEKKAAENRRKNVESIAKGQVDDIVKAYKEGEISLYEMQELYTQVYKACTDERVEIEEYASEKITAVRKEVAEKNLKQLKDNIKSEISEYNKQLEDVQKSIESTSAKLSGDISDMYSFEKDDKGKTVAKLNDLNAKQAQLDRYYSNINKLVNNGINDAMIEQLADMSLEQGAALAETWSKMSIEELDGVAKKFENITKTSDKISALIYDKKSKQVATAMINSMKNITAGSEEFSEMGGSIIDKMLEGLSNDSATSKIKAACDKIIEAFKSNLNIEVDGGLKEQLNNVGTSINNSVPVSSNGGRSLSMTRQSYGSGAADVMGGGNTVNVYQTNNFGGKSTLADQEKANQRLAAQLSR
ncbi:MAG: hypothetical protein ACI4JK_03415 [Oscillospiraceae bacterium]